MSVKSVVLICGGGNGAHCFAGLASLKSNIESRVRTLYFDETERWAAKLTRVYLSLSETMTVAKVL